MSLRGPACDECEVACRDQVRAREGGRAELCAGMAACGGPALLRCSGVVEGGSPPTNRRKNPKQMRREAALSLGLTRSQRRVGFGFEVPVVVIPVRELHRGLILSAGLILFARVPVDAAEIDVVRDPVGLIRD